MNDRDREELLASLDGALERTSHDFGRLLALASRDDLAGMCRLLDENGRPGRSPADFGARVP